MSHDPEDAFAQIFRERAETRRRAEQEKAARNSRAQAFRRAFREQVGTVVRPTLEFLVELLERNGIEAEILEAGTAEEAGDTEPSIGLRANAEDRRPTRYLADATVQLTYSCSVDQRVVTVAGICTIKGHGPVSRGGSAVSIQELTEEAVHGHFLALMRGQRLG